MKYLIYQQFPDQIEFQGKIYYKTKGWGESVDIKTKLISHRYTSNPLGIPVNSVPLYMDANGKIEWD